MLTRMICSKNGRDIFNEKLPSFIFISVASFMISYVACVPLVGKMAYTCCELWIFVTAIEILLNVVDFQFLKDGYLYRLICGFKQGSGEIQPLVNRVTSRTLNSID